MRELVTSQNLFANKFCSRPRLGRYSTCEPNNMPAHFNSLRKDKQLSLLMSPRYKKRPKGRFLYLGDVVEEVRTVFERKNDTTIYIPTFCPTLEYTIS